MDHKEIQAIWDAFQSIQEKKLSDKQKELDVDNDGDIEGDDLAALRNNKKKLKRGVTEKSDCPKCSGEGCKHCDGKGFHEEAPADPVKKAPARKGDKSNPDSSNLKGVQEAYLRMKEDVEQVDEDIAHYKVHRSSNSGKTWDHDEGDTYASLSRAKEIAGNMKSGRGIGVKVKITKHVKPKLAGPAGKLPEETDSSVEQVDELKSSTLGSYLKKSKRSEREIAKKTDAHKSKGEWDKADKSFGKEMIRMRGQNRATDSLVKKASRSEGVEHIEEGPLSKAALDRKGQTFSHFKVAASDKASKYLDKKQKDKNAEINKNDPKMAKFYGRSIVDTDKAVKKAVKKGLNKDKVKKSLNWRHKNSAQKSKLPEEVELRWAQSLAEMLSDISEKKDEHTKGATESEKYDSKFSKGAKDFVAMHQKSDKEMEDKEQKGHDDVSKAGRATKAAAGRGAADQLKNGDKSVVKPVSGVVTKETK